MRGWRRSMRRLLLLVSIVVLPQSAHPQSPAPVTQEATAAPLDLFVCLDSSTSMGEDNYDRLKAALTSFLSKLPVSERQIRVGVRPFSWTLSAQFVPLTGNASALYEGVLRLPYMRGSTRTDLAIEDAVAQLTADGRPTAAKAIVVLTDGMPTYPSNAMAMVKRAQSLNIEMFAVGFGSLVSVVGLYSLAPDSHVYKEQSFDQVPEELLSVARIQMESQETTIIVNLTTNPPTSSTYHTRTTPVSNSATSTLTSRTTTTTTKEAATASQTTAAAVSQTPTTIAGPVLHTSDASSDGATTAKSVWVGTTSSSHVNTRTTSSSSQFSTRTTMNPPGDTTSAEPGAAHTSAGLNSVRTEITITISATATGVSAGAPSGATLSTLASTGLLTAQSIGTTSLGTPDPGTSAYTPTPSLPVGGSHDATEAGRTIGERKSEATTAPRFVEGMTTASSSAAASSLSTTLFAGEPSRSSPPSPSETSTGGPGRGTAVTTASPRPESATTRAGTSPGPDTVASSGSSTGTGRATSAEGPTAPRPQSTQSGPPRTTAEPLTRSEEAGRSPVSSAGTTRGSDRTTQRGGPLDTESQPPDRTTTQARNYSATPATAPWETVSTDSPTTTSTDFSTTTSTDSPTTTSTDLSTTTSSDSPTTTSSDSSATPPSGEGRASNSSSGCGQDAAKDFLTGRATDGELPATSGRSDSAGCSQLKGGICGRPGVKVMEGVGYLSHPFNCGRYVQCYPGANGTTTAVIRVCGPGLFWNMESLRCEEARKSKCSYDLCRNFDIAHHKMEGNCRTFWRCQDGRSVPSCCGRGRAYIPGQGCVPCTRCADACPTSCRSRPACRLRPDPLFPQGYFVHLGALGWMPDACPFGLFDVSKCSCSAESSLDLGCKPHFLTSFDDRGALSAVRTTTVNVILASSVGLFPGNARVSVPLSFVDILARKADRPLRVNLRYKELSPINDGDHQLLVQSAPCVFGGLLAVYVNKAAVYLRIFTQQGEISSTEVFTEGFDISSWKSLRIRYSSSDGLRVTVSSKTLTYTSFIEVPPDLSVSECGWTFGYPERLDHLSPFTGGMDDIEVAYC